MARDFATAFYHSPAWKKTRESYMKLGQGLCEPCLRRGRYTQAAIVHHKVHLSPENINDPKITLDYSNLERVCRDCHAKEHPEIYGDANARAPRWTFDEEGNVVLLDCNIDNDSEAGRH